MQVLLNDRYPLFMSSYKQTANLRLRVNALKISVTEFIKLQEFRLSPVSWCAEEFYYNKKDTLGKHIFHDAGLYYIQEPSAMKVVAMLDIKPGEKVLDLCATPGGKAGQIAAKLSGRGLLLANEINPTRAKILAKIWKDWQ